MNTLRIIIALVIVSMLTISVTNAQEHSIARQWNEQILNAIRGDYARPTVHARNLFHTSIAMYDAWAVYDDKATPYFLGKKLGNYTCPFEGTEMPEDVETARETALSYAVYNLLIHRFANSPSGNITIFNLNQFMGELGYDITFNSVDYSDGNPAALGNYIAQQLIAAGLVDGSNEAGEYANQHYNPINGFLDIANMSSSNIVNPNNWQPIFLVNFIDQSGNPVGETPEFLGPEWGNVVPFALKEEDKETLYKNGNAYQVYHNPGAPDYFETEETNGIGAAYKWGFSLVSVWASHLDPADGVMWDISPASIGNIPSFPETSAELPDFYDLENGGDTSVGHSINPITGMPYEEQIVARADYARVLAEFWADGPESETPPGHWFTILNEVKDHPLSTTKWNGTGEELPAFEYDVKTYLTLAGAMHDSAISAWSVKGWYDYIRPVSAIRYMAELGQSTDPNLSNYNEGGIPLIPNYIEVVQSGDPLAMADPNNLGKIKLYTWKGPDYINNPVIDVAGVDWILAEDWWPYQRPSFVTPPFAGYVSGHSTFSRAAAEVLTLITGSEYFPGGIGEFEAPMNQFLVFEEGPSQNITLQWATYRDASDQCSLSRIWGGIHPPCDDIPGRKMGMKIGPDAYYHAIKFFDSVSPEFVDITISNNVINDASDGLPVSIQFTFNETMNTNIQPIISFNNELINDVLDIISIVWINDTTLEVTFEPTDSDLDFGSIDITLGNVFDIGENILSNNVWENIFDYDTENAIPEITANYPTLTDFQLASTISLTVTYPEVMNTLISPEVNFPVDNPTNQSLALQSDFWIDEYTYLINYTLTDANEALSEIIVEITGAFDEAGNLQEPTTAAPFTIDTENPNLQVTFNTNLVNDEQNKETVIVNFIYSEPMNQTVIPDYTFTKDNPTLNSLNIVSAEWWTENRYVVSYKIVDVNETLNDITLQVNGAQDIAGNLQTPYLESNLLIVDTENPTVTISTNAEAVSDTLITQGFVIELAFNETMDTLSIPTLIFNNDPLATLAALTLEGGEWENQMLYKLNYSITDNNELLNEFDIAIENAKDLANNTLQENMVNQPFIIDTENPTVAYIETNYETIVSNANGLATFSVITIYNEAMNTDNTPVIEFIHAEDLSNLLTVNTEESNWINDFTYVTKYDVGYYALFADDIDISITNAYDYWLNKQIAFEATDAFSIQFDPSVGTNEIETTNEIKVYPNPVGNGQSINVQIENTQSVSNVKLINLNGSVVYEMNNSFSDNIEIPTKGLTSGFYFLVTESKNKKHFTKLIIN